MSKKNDLLLAATFTLSAGRALTPEEGSAAPKKGAASVECFGINTAKGTNGCSIGKSQIEAANHAYANRFAKSKPVDCAGNSDCSARDGFLAWVAKANADECYKDGGFLFEKDAAGKILVKDKALEKKS